MQDNTILQRYVSRPRLLDEVLISLHQVASEPRSPVSVVAVYRPSWQGLDLDNKLAFVYEYCGIRCVSDAARRKVGA